MKSGIAAIVLAGGQDELARTHHVASKALLPLNGKTMAHSVLNAVKKSPFINTITFVGTTNEALSGCFDQAVASGEHLADSLEFGLKASKPFHPDKFFIITSDLPWITREAIDDFLVNAPEADLIYVGISEEAAKTQFPQQKRTLVKLKEGRFTGGNVMLLKPDTEKKLIPFINKAYAARKNPLKLAQIVGFKTTLALASGKLTLKTLETRVSELLHLNVRLYISNFASIGADIDKLEHLEEAHKYFASSSS